MRKRMLKALKGPAALKALQADLVRAESLGMPSDYCGRLTVQSTCAFLLFRKSGNDAFPTAS